MTWDRLRECCGNCKFWELWQQPRETSEDEPFGTDQGSGGAHSNCRRHAPTRGKPVAGMSFPEFPIMPRSGYCGDFRPGRFYRHATNDDVLAEIKRRHPGARVEHGPFGVWSVLCGVGSTSYALETIARDLRGGIYPTPSTVDNPTEPS